MSKYNIPQLEELIIKYLTLKIYKLCHNKLILNKLYHVEFKVQLIIFILLIHFQLCRTQY